MSCFIVVSMKSYSKVWRKIALDFSGAKFSLRLFVGHEFDMADETSLKSGKAMLKDPLEGLVKCNGLTILAK